MAPLEKIVDARELEAPLPLEYAVKTVMGLKDGEYLKMVHRMHPCKLGEVLSAMGMSYLYFEDNNTHYVFAWHKYDNATKQYILEKIKNEYGRTFAI